MQDSQGGKSENTSSVSQPGLALPNESFQNQIHALAKTLPPPRKQNTACDACRTRKVKCIRMAGQTDCQHCLSKSYPCTHFVQQETSRKKRSTVTARRPRNLSIGSRSNIPQSIPELYASPKVDARTHSGSSTSPQASAKSLSPPLDGHGSSVSPGPSSGGFPPGPPFYPLPGFPPLTTSTPTSQLLAYMFAPPYVPFEMLHTIATPYAEWGPEAVKLQDENFRTEFAIDLVEVFFQIVHTRLPLLNPSQFRARLNLRNDPNQASLKPLHPALVATVLAWGAKFSEHPLLIADRRRLGGQSLLAKAMVDRARELAESLKVHRVPSTDHVVIALLVEPLQSQSPGDPSGFHGFWLASGIRNLLDMQINHKSVMSNIRDPDDRGTMIFAWWMACLADAYSAIYYRRKPMLDDDDYDIDFYVADGMSDDVINSKTPQPSPREQLEFLGYYRAAHALARIARQMARQLWRPSTDADGMPYDTLCIFTKALADWRTEYLKKIGVPANIDASWDFVSVVTACASDATYHIMWVILFAALDDFGIREIREVMEDDRAGTPPALSSKYEAIKKTVADEALNAALKIAGLAGVLSSNGYLRLDPAVMHVSCIQAGTLLARLGRPEVSNCITALEQYGPAYEEAGGQAVEIRRIYEAAKSGDFTFDHMTSVAPRVNVVDNNAMMVDAPPRGHNPASLSSILI